MLTWKGCNKWIDRRHQRLLRLILNDYELSVYDIPSTLIEETIRWRCANILFTELYECLDSLSLGID